MLKIERNTFFFPVNLGIVMELFFYLDIVNVKKILIVIVYFALYTDKLKAGPLRHKMSIKKLESISVMDASPSKASSIKGGTMLEAVFCRGVNKGSFLQYIYYVYIKSSF